MKKLIVNADDFGLTRSITDGIIKGVRQGIIRGASFIVNTDAFEYSVEQAKAFPQIDIGIHIAWVGEDSSVAKNAGSLLKDRNFHPNWKSVIINRVLRKIKLSDAENEARAQIEKLLKAGIHLSHIDTHQHLHLLPGFTEIIIKIAKEYRIPFVRCPEVRKKRLFYVKPFSRRLRKILLEEGFPKPMEFWGFECSGRFSLDYLAEIVKKMSTDVAELMVHPGLEDEQLHNKYKWGYNWEKELYCILSEEAKEILKENNVLLTSFKELMADINFRNIQNLDPV